MDRGQKHLISCRCILPQFKSRSDPPFHKFIVFSVLDDKDKLKQHFAQCNHCGAIHKVTDICTSTILNKDEMMSIETIKDISGALSEQIRTTLESYDADLPTWQHARFIVENKRWGEFVLLNSDEAEGLKQGKYMRILGTNLIKVETFSLETLVTN